LIQWCLSDPPKLRDSLLGLRRHLHPQLTSHNIFARAMADFLLHEGPMGYALFKSIHQPDTIGNRLKELQETQQDLAKFGKMVQLVSFLPFENGKQALEEMHDVCTNYSGSISND
jgi:hypothetical protein